MRAECLSSLAGRAPTPGCLDSKRKHNGGGRNHEKPPRGTSGAAFMAGSNGNQPNSELSSIDDMGMMKWSMDSGSTHTNTLARECIHDFVSASPPYRIVRDAGGNQHEVMGHGKVIMRVVLPNNQQTTLTMTEVNYVPTFTCNLGSWKRANLRYGSRGDAKWLRVWVGTWMESFSFMEHGVRHHLFLRFTQCYLSGAQYATTQHPHRLSQLLLSTCMKYVVSGRFLITFSRTLVRLFFSLTSSKLKVKSSSTGFRVKLNPRVKLNRVFSSSLYTPDFCLFRSHV